MKYAIAALIAAAALSLSACGMDARTVNTKSVPVDGGGFVVCAGGDAGGIDCNWDAYNKANGK